MNEKKSSMFIPEIVSIDTMEIAKAMLKAGYPSQIDPDDPMMCDREGWGGTLLDTLQKHYALEDHINDALEGLKK